MLQLPQKAHRYFVEPLTKTRHIKFALLKRFLRFIKNVSSSNKEVMKNMLLQCKYDCQSTTGENLRRIMLLTKNTRVVDIDVKDIDKLSDEDIPEGEGWRIALAKDLIETKNERNETTLITRNEVKELLQTVVT